MLSLVGEMWLVEANDMNRMDQSRLADYLGGWLRQRVKESKTQGAVVNNSGGVDSAVVIGLCARAGLDTVTLVQPCESKEEDVVHARLVAKRFEVPCLELDLDKVLYAYLHILEPAFQQVEDSEKGGLARANLKPRLRMVSLYYFANRLNYLAVGTGNLSELTVGYFTKYGDGGTDALPLGNLVKREVYALARFLGVPSEVVEKPPSAGLWAGQTDEKELGFTYDQLDDYIRNGAVAEEVAERIRALYKASEHKRHMPPVPAPWEGE